MSPCGLLFVWNNCASFCLTRSLVMPAMVFAKLGVVVSTLLKIRSIFELQSDLQGLEMPNNLLYFWFSLLDFLLVTGLQCQMIFFKKTLQFFFVMQVILIWQVKDLPCHFLIWTTSVTNQILFQSYEKLATLKISKIFKKLTWCLNYVLNFALLSCCHYHYCLHFDAL